MKRVRDALIVALLVTAIAFVSVAVCQRFQPQPQIVQVLPVVVKSCPKEVGA